jgi:DNA polymerase-3 subunit delta
LISEAHKLITFTGGKPVTLEDLDTLCGELEQFDPIWSAWVSGRWTTSALHSLKLALIHMNAAQIFSRAAAHIQDQYRLKLWQQMGVPQETIATRAGKHPYRVKLALGSLQKISMVRLSDLRAKALELDWRFKSGQYSDALALDLLLAS